MTNMPKVTPGEGALGTAAAALTANYIATGNGEWVTCVALAALAVSHAIIRYARNAYSTPIVEEDDDDDDDLTDLTMPEEWDPVADPADTL